MMVHTYLRKSKPERGGPSYERVYHTDGMSFYRVCQSGSAGRASLAPEPVWSGPRGGEDCAEDRRALADRQALRCLYQSAGRSAWAGGNQQPSESRCDLAGRIRTHPMRRAVGDTKDLECLHCRERDTNG